MLYIEENALDIAHMRKLLSQWPLVSLVIRKTLEKGMQAVEMLHPDLVVVNINLAGAQETEPLLSLRQNPESRHIPVIATGSGPSPDTVKWRELGYDDYITQPVDEPMLRDLLLSTLKEHDHV